MAVLTIAANLRDWKYDGISVLLPLVKQLAGLPSNLWKISVQKMEWSEIGNSYWIIGCLPDLRRIGISNYIVFEKKCSLHVY